MGTLFYIFSVLLIVIFTPAEVNSIKILIATGNPISDAVTSEVINLENENEICDNLIDFPREIEGATGFFGGLPLICGGTFDHTTPSNECYLLNTNSTKFDLFASLSHNRTFAGIKRVHVKKLSKKTCGL